MPIFETILVPTDFSADAAAALETAVGLAKRLGAKISLIHCFRVDPSGTSPYEIAEPTAYRESVRAAATRELESRAEKVAAEGVAVDWVVVSEFPPEAIARRAREIDADLIVMGTRGLSGFKHAMLGSVAERTLRLAPCAVWTAKTTDATASGADTSNT
jgi:nucleotide-binding universal stress UspA family protein